MSGSWDSTVKIWSLKSANGMLSPHPVAEFFDHEHSVMSVAIEENDGYFAAAGAEDGTVIIWDTRLASVIASMHVGRNNRYDYIRAVLM